MNAFYFQWARSSSTHVHSRVPSVQELEVQGWERVRSHPSYTDSVLMRKDETEMDKLKLIEDSLRELRNKIVLDRTITLERVLTELDQRLLDIESMRTKHRFADEAPQ